MAPMKPFDYRHLLLLEAALKVSRLCSRSNEARLNPRCLEGDCYARFGGGGLRNDGIRKQQKR